MIENKQKGELALKAGSWYAVSSILVKSATVITTPIFSRMMSTDEYGMVATFISWHALLLPVFSLELTYSIGRAKLDFPDELDQYIGSVQLLAGIFSVVLAGLMILFIQPISSVLELNKEGTILLALYMIFSPTIAFYQNGYRFRYKYKQNIAIAWYVTLSSTLLSLCLMHVMGNDLSFWRMIGITVPTVVLSAAFWMKSLKNRLLKVNRTYWTYGLKISLPLILHSISMHILSQSDRIFITKFCGSGDTGIYSLAYTYGILLSVITTAIAQGWLPWFHDTYFEGNIDLIKKSIVPLVVFGCYIGLACIAFGPEAIRILGGEKYMRGVQCIPPIVLGVVCQFIYTHYVNIELHLKKTMYVSYGTVFAAGMNIVLNALCIPRFGFVAAAYTTLASYFALMIVHFLITRRVLKVKVYNDIFMFGALAVTAAISGVLMMVYSRNLIRYIIIAVGFISFLMYFRSYLKKICRKFFKK